ncbi:hypothetical protein PFISCL1PPCAC_23365, partial [Pristionchus fissidentatus]
NEAAGPAAEVAPPVVATTAAAPTVAAEEDDVPVPPRPDPHASMSEWAPKCLDFFMRAMEMTTRGKNPLDVFTMYEIRVIDLELSVRMRTIPTASFDLSKLLAKVINTKEFHYCPMCEQIILNHKILFHHMMDFDNMFNGERAFAMVNLMMMRMIETSGASVWHDEEDIIDIRQRKK